MITIRIDEKEPTLLVVSFSEDPVGNNLIREIAGRRWSYSRRCWLLPNTRDSVVKVGKLFGKAYCRFDEAVVRLYKPDASSKVIESATNPLWPPQQANAQSKPFRYMPPVLEYDQHPIIIAGCNALQIGNYSYRTLKNYKQALIALIRYAGSIPLDELTRAQYQAYLLFLTEKND